MGRRGLRTRSSLRPRRRNILRKKEERSCLPAPRERYQELFGWIVITDKNGKQFTATSNSVGNFTLSAAQMPGFTPPYTAKIAQGGKERAMVAPQTDGDCNGCHTEMGAGTPAAPGRIMAP